MVSHVDFVGVLFIVWGLLTTLVGLSTLALGIGAVALLALMLGCIDLVLLPYGTALGIYTLWALLNEQGKALFATDHPASRSG